MKRLTFLLVLILTACGTTIEPNVQVEPEPEPCICAQYVGNPCFDYCEITLEENP